MTTTGNPGEFRSRDNIRRGAEQGVAQVLTAVEALALLDEGAAHQRAAAEVQRIEAELDTEDARQNGQWRLLTLSKIEGAKAVLGAIDRHDD
jgi:hypothetical protein